MSHEVDDFRVDDDDSSLVVNLPDERAACFDHFEWQNNVLKTEGYKAQLHAHMLEDALEVWKTHGKSAFIQAIEESPASFVRAIQALLPKKVDIDVNSTARSVGDLHDTPRLTVLKDLMRLEPPVYDTAEVIDDEGSPEPDEETIT